MLQWKMGWSMGTERISKMIASLDRVRDGQCYLPAAFSHSFLTFQAPGGPEIIFESHLDHGVQMTPFAALEDSSKVSRYFTTPIETTAAQSDALWQACISKHGKAYDTRHIIGLLLWIKTWGHKQTKVPGFLKWALNDKYICSELVETVGREAGFDWCAQVCTPVTATPESLYFARFGEPSIWRYV